MKKIVLYFLILLSQKGYTQNWDIDLLNAVNSSQPQPFATAFFKDVSLSSYVISIAAPIFCVIRRSSKEG